MSKQERAVERDMADWYDASQRPPDVDKGPFWPRAKQFGEGFLTGLVCSSLIRKIF